MIALVALALVGAPVLAIVLLAHWLLERYVSSQSEGRMRWPAHQLVLLGSFQNYMDAQTMAARLHAAGIRTTYTHSSPYSWGAGEFDVRVLGRDVERAKRVLASHPAHHGGNQKRRS